MFKTDLPGNMAGLRDSGSVFDILSALKGEDPHGTVPLVWDGYGL